MFTAMRSRRDSEPKIIEPCPCNDICRCHKPPPEDKHFARDMILIVLGFIILISVIMTLLSFSLSSKPVKHYVKVKDEICELKYIETGRTGFRRRRSVGYNIAICPSDIK